MKGRLWKKALAAAMAMLVGSGALPVKPAADLFGDLVISASADDYSGSCDENVTWELTQNAYDTNYTLTISGEGAMADYSNSQNSPWWKKYNDITTVDIESGVTSIGAYGSIPNFV